MVLTAAHCFDQLPPSLITNSKKIRVKVGVSDINKDFGSWVENRTHVATIGEVIKYTDYKQNIKGYLNPFNDIAIVKLNNTKGEKKYACLPTSIPERDEDKNSSIITGWGRVDPFVLGELRHIPAEETVDHLCFSMIPRTDFQSQELFHLGQKFVGQKCLESLQKFRVIYLGLKVFWKEIHSVKEAFK